MGLDMYLRAETKLNISERGQSTGACGGLFPMRPEAGNTQEIGYWRKAYAQAHLILENSTYDGGEDNCRDILITKDQVTDIIIKASLELLKLKDSDDDNVYDRNDWENTVEFFTTAKKIYEQDPEAKIYYFQWY